MQKLKRIMSLILSITLILTALPVTVFAGNNDGSGSTVGGGTPADGWKVTGSHEGLRI